MIQAISTTPIIANTPSLLRQIVDEVDSMNEEEKAALLRKIKMEKTVQKLKAFEDSLPSISISEEEISEMCSATRKEMYEEKKAKSK